MKKILLFILSLFVSCSTIAQKNQKPPQEIEAVYFQHWSGGQEMTGSGTDFYIELKAPLAKDVVLSKIVFRNRETKLDKITDTKYVGHFYQRPEVIVDENGNRNIVHKAPETVKTNYKLGENEARLEFVKNKKNGVFKITEIKEKELLAYPSAPPMNRN
jgi:hypothetical protein